MPTPKKSPAKRPVEEVAGSPVATPSKKVKTSPKKSPSPKKATPKVCQLQFECKFVLWYLGCHVVILMCFVLRC